MKKSGASQSQSASELISKKIPRSFDRRSPTKFWQAEIFEESEV
jgi:hypothetical protein